MNDKQRKAMFAKNKSKRDLESLPFDNWVKNHKNEMNTERLKNAKDEKHKAMASIIEKHHNELKNHLNKHLEKHPNRTIKVNPLTEREKTLAIKVINDSILDYDDVHIGNDNDYSKDDLKRVIKKIKLGYDKFTPKEANALNSSSYMALMSINDNDEYPNREKTLKVMDKLETQTWSQKKKWASGFIPNAPKL